MSNSKAHGLKHFALLSPGWTLPLPCPPDCSYHCSLLFQGAFLDCSGPTHACHSLLPSSFLPRRFLVPACLLSLPLLVSLLWLPSPQADPDRALPPAPQEKSWAQSSCWKPHAGSMVQPFSLSHSHCGLLPQFPGLNLRRTVGECGVRKAWFIFCARNHSTMSSLASPSLSFRIC